MSTEEQVQDDQRAAAHGPFREAEILDPGEGSKCSMADSER